MNSSPYPRYFSGALEGLRRLARLLCKTEHKACHPPTCCNPAEFKAPAAKASWATANGASDIARRTVHG
jgi:hypothetical protein